MGSHDRNAPGGRNGGACGLTYDTPMQRIPSHQNEWLWVRSKHEEKYEIDTKRKEPKTLVSSDRDDPMQRERMGIATSDSIYGIYGEHGVSRAT